MIWLGSSPGQVWLAREVRVSSTSKSSSGRSRGRRSSGAGGSCTRGSCGAIRRFTELCTTFVFSFRSLWNDKSFKAMLPLVQHRRLDEQGTGRGGAQRSVGGAVASAGRGSWQRGVRCSGPGQRAAWCQGCQRAAWCQGKRAAWCQRPG